MSDSQSETMLTISNLVKSHGERKVLKGVSMTHCRKGGWCHRTVGVGEEHDSVPHQRVRRFPSGRDHD